ncbi:hypothetical protein NEF87_000353 [Candidatus Lokiarchaeum ossiferum]|uniref:Lcl C-terminal domain-containing protein n=1 Tax=Candidatus Lokiarchaeum ossiferum TaxID=2951803 RepID=A0ABY6HKN1_9ARCH|nr:hypothetical protein NEF87_000353 [Candidatus Lokiarchaeum sp. B-35]
MDPKYRKVALISLLSVVIIISAVVVGLLYNGAKDAEVSNTVVEKTNNFSYAIVDTGQTTFFGNLESILEPSLGDDFYGQDAQYTRFSASYVDNEDGTVTDLNTGLMWQQDPGEKMTYDDAVSGADSFVLSQYDDWRLPTIKELYSLILFTGEDPSGEEGDDTSNLVPFIDTDYFVFEYGDTANRERIIDAQYVSSTVYESTTMDGAETVFGVNFADGRIKGYGTGTMPGQPDGKLFTVMYVRGNLEYGQNEFIDNTDKTITDNATGLMWAQEDSGESMLWEDALAWVQQKNAENYLGYSDWCLPNVKELQSIVDYSRCPDTTDSAAIDPLFNCTIITNELNVDDYAFYWSGTTHASSNGLGANAAYVAFGESLGYMDGEWQDVHGAGSQRSDPKVGDPDDYTEGHGPQGDCIRILNSVRLVRIV